MYTFSLAKLHVKCQVGRTGGVPDENEAKLQILLLFVPLFDQAFLRATKWLD